MESEVNWRCNRRADVGEMIEVKVEEAWSVREDMGEAASSLGCSCCYRATPLVESW